MKSKTYHFKLHTPQLLKEITECGLAPQSGVLFVPINTLRILLGKVAERAAQLNDPILNKLMCDMTLYEIADPRSKDFSKKQIKEIENKAKIQEKREGRRWIASEANTRLKQIQPGLVI